MTEFGTSGVSGSVTMIRNGSADTGRTGAKASKAAARSLNPKPVMISFQEDALPGPLGPPAHHPLFDEADAIHKEHSHDGQNGDNDEIGRHTETVPIDRQQPAQP